MAGDVLTWSIIITLSLYLMMTRQREAWARTYPKPQPSKKRCYWLPSDDGDLVVPMPECKPPKPSV